jgi:allophanate hydrolase
MNEESDFTLPALAAAYAAGRTTPTRVLAQALARMQAAGDNPVWISRVPEAAAMARAQALEHLPEAERARLPLYGIPFAVKDNIDVEGLPTTAACPEYAYTPARSATAVRRLLEAGAMLLGKTNLDQFATGLVGTRSPYGACRNAFDPAYISGGSSSGSAISVALGMASFSLGTDTAGSGRVPAAFNNLVGLKPTRGLVPTTGVVPACRSLDCISVFALSVADALTVLGVMEGVDAEDAYSRSGEGPAFGPARFRFAVPRADQLEFFGDEQYARLYAGAARRLEQIGGLRVEVDIAPLLQAQELLYGGPWIAERLAQLEDFLADHAEAFHPVTRAVVESGRCFSAADAFRGAYRLAALRRESEAVWKAADLLLLPGAPTIYTLAELEAHPIEYNSRLGLYTNFVNLLDLAGITVPAGFRKDGLPFGVTLVGPAFSDRSLAAIGARLHEAGCEKVGAMPWAVPAARIHAPASSSTVRVAVVGAHLSGMPLNGQLTERGARLVRTARTAPNYRLYALADQVPHKPGLVRVADGHGSCIELEIWELPTRDYGTFVAGIPGPLGIGTLELENGERLQGFLCESHAVQDKTDISAYGGWRSYVAALARGDGACA